MRMLALECGGFRVSLPRLCLGYCVPACILSEGLQAELPVDRRDHVVQLGCMRCRLRAFLMEQVLWTLSTRGMTDFN